jgi:carbamoyl-phosphate synthase large subunit
MKSVGEAMAIGRSFEESFQKALRSLETGRAGWGCDRPEKLPSLPIFAPSCAPPTPIASLTCATPWWLGRSVDEIHGSAPSTPGSSTKLRGS